jgi:hypothetical protein
MLEAPVLMVGTDPDVVEAELVGGGLACPVCGGVLGPWGHARWRVVRHGEVEERLRPRRGRCRSCSKTHVILRWSCLFRRRDDVATIGDALERRASGSGYRRIAKGVGQKLWTVRGWLRAFAREAETVRAHFTRWAYALDAMLGPTKVAGDGFADAVGAVGVAGRAWVLRFGPTPVWEVAAQLSGGMLLFHTSSPLPPLG